MELREAKLKMISAIDGGWDVAAAYLGMTTNALRNRVYEVKEQKLSDENSLALQHLSKTTFYADAIAQASGGSFVLLPTGGEFENADLMKKFNELYTLLGTFSGDFNAAIKNDDVIDGREQHVLEEDVHQLHKCLSEVLALMIHVYGVGKRGEKHGG